MSPMDLNPKDNVPIEKRADQLICKRCGAKVDPATGRCTNKECGLLHGTEQWARQQTPPSTAKPSINVGPAAKPPSDARQFLGEIPRHAAREPSIPPTPQSPLLEEIRHSEQRGRGFPKQEKREKQVKIKESYSEPREWNFSSIRRFIQPVLASLLLLGIAASLIFLVARVAIPYTSQFISKIHLSTSPAPTTLLESYSLSIIISPQDSGTISRFPEKETYAPKDELTMTAIPASCYIFDHWGDDVSDSSPTKMIIMDTDKTFTAHFSIKDTTPPVISEVKATNVTDSSTTIIWATNEKTTSQVEYGETDSYGQTAPSVRSLSDNHTVQLTGLKPNAAYHFTVEAEDECHNHSKPYKDQTFTTLSPIPIGNEVGNRAPDFTLLYYQDEDPNSPNKGQSFDSNFSSRGQKVVLNFWGTYCGACIIEFPDLRAIYHKYGNNSGDIAVITVCLDGESTDRMQELFAQYGEEYGPFDFPILVDTEHSAERYNIWATPTTVFINSEGIIKYIQIGRFASPEEIENILQSL